MIICDNPQGSEEWLADRLGVPSASSFGKIITATGKPSTSAPTYMNQLLAEWLAGEPVDAWEGNQWTEIGNEREQQARDQYSFISDNEVEQVGFCLKDDRKLVGMSPDGLVGDKGLVEIKSPKASTLVGYHLDNKLPNTYKPQVMGQLWVSEREWCDFFVYHPSIEPFMLRVERDDGYINDLEKQLNIFIEKMLDKREQLKPLKEAA
jgi:putative phage-type endonuclease